MSSISKYTTPKGKQLWRVSVYAGVDPRTGKKKYVGKKGLDSRQKATLVAARLEVAVAEGDLDKPKDKVMTFKEVADEWFADYETTVRESTLVVTSAFFRNHIIPEFGTYRIATITTRDIQNAVKKWAGISQKAYKRWFSFTHLIFKYALERGYIHDDPARFIKLPKAVEDTISDEDKFWSKEEIDAFLQCIDPSTDLEKYVMFRLYCLSGLRRAELLALHFSDCDFKENTISVVRTLSQAEHGRAIIQPPKTRASNRTIPLDKTTMQWLKRWQVTLYQKQMLHGVNSMQGEGIIFPSTKGGYKSLNTPRAWLVKIIKDNHLKPISLHKLRHSYISNMLMSGAPVSAVQKLVGHSDPSLTLRIYSHVNLDEKKKAAAGLAKYLDL
ncbi:tyrosine-type recombinase/integrase [Lacticaseibacillus suibinensis]|uniref:tyrosine-type recombinase/integrase n=1 Tax=Lacticaseibacillus suibinensis TaxID=2486011 RepID=UPI000F7942A6|nr:site-specific integrase [Lacticaseibacillus suibinensis]